MTQTNSKFNPQDLVDLALDGQSAEYSAKVLSVAFKAKVEPNDPLFLVLMATGRLEFLLLESPSSLNLTFEDNLQKTSAFLNSCEGVALETQKAAIASAVSALVVKSQSLQRGQRDSGVPAVGGGASIGFSIFSWSGLKLAGAVLVSLVVGGWFGYVIQARHQGSAVGQGLTAEQAQALAWAQSKEGNFAHNLVRWNADLLDGMECKKDTQRLGVTLVIEGKKSKSGFCTLWVEPPSDRQFVAEDSK